MRISNVVMVVMAIAVAWPALASDIVPPKVVTMTPTGIGVADASYNYTATDLTIGTLSLDRFYRMTPGTAQDPDAMFNGLRTSNNFDIFVTPSYVPQSGDYPYVTPPHPAPIVHLGAATSGTYRQTGFSAPITIIPNSAEADQGTLQWVSGAYVYTDQSGTIYTFNPSVTVVGSQGGVYATNSQRIATITYPEGRVRSFSYNSSGQLKLVTDSSGYAIVFDWTGTGSSATMAAACGFDLAQNYVTASATCTGATLKVSYGYTGNLLTSFVDVLGQTTTYSYAGGGFISTYLACITPPGYSSCKISNNYTDGNTLVQTLADGSVWRVHAANIFQQTDDYVPSDGDNFGGVTDPLGKGASYYFTGTTPYTATDANGMTTSYRYTGSLKYDSTAPATAAGSILTEVDLPEGNKYLAENYGPYKTISKQTWRSKTPSTDPDVVQQFGYNCTGGILTPACTKPTSRTDARGNVTNYDYYSWGGIKSEMQPAPTTGAARPLKLYDYLQKFAYIKNSAGTLVASSTPIWVSNTETVCQTVAGSSTAACDAGAPITVTTYEYGANGTADNLLVRGKVVTTNTPSGAPTLRTCYGYDAQSNKIWETSPRAGLVSCS